MIRRLTICGMVIFATAFDRASASAPTPAPTGPEAFLLAEDALLQLGGMPSVYLTSADGLVEAIDAGSGKLRWRSGKTAFVLAARGDRLLALRTSGPADRGGCAPVFLDTRSGRIVRDAGTPEGHLPGCPGYGISGSCLYAPFFRDGVDFIGWMVSWHPTPGGAYRGPEFKYPPGSSGSRQGACAVEWLTSGLAPAASALTESVAVLHPSPNAMSATVTMDGLSACADRVLEAGKVARLVLRRWRADARLPDVALGEPPWASCGVSFTADGRHVLAVWQVPEKHDPIMYHVRVFAVVTGELIGEADATSWPIGGAMIGSTLVTYFPNRVFAVDLKTGHEHWSRPVKDLQYHGPYPPAARPSANAESVPIR